MTLALLDRDMITLNPTPPGWWLLAPRAEPHEVLRWGLVDEKCVLVCQSSTGAQLVYLPVPATVEIRDIKAHGTGIDALQVLRSALVDEIEAQRARGVRVTCRPTVRWDTGLYRLLLAPGPYEGAESPAAGVAKVYRGHNRVLMTAHPLRKPTPCAQCGVPLPAGDTAWSDVANGSTRYERICGPCMDDLCAAGLP